MFPVPTSLSPSRVDAFTNCPLAFRFSSIEKLYEPPSVATTRGSLVHRALELLFTAPPSERTPTRLDHALDTALAEYRELPDLVDLDLDDAELHRFEADCRDLAANYLQMEDPTSVHEIGLELRLEAEVDGLTLRGVIDRLELDEHGGLVVTDYKTGRAPSTNFEQKSLGGVHFYALLCDQVFGQRPSAVRLMYLKTGETITATPSAQSVRFLTTRTRAVWQAVERACTSGEFLPRQSALCRSCAFQRWCPEFGGDPDRAAIEAGTRSGSGADTGVAAPSVLARP
ncbi:MAG: PD-(D/E)XK nuclease family protein [Ilumatobacteraceae bacterium]